MSLNFSDPNNPYLEFTLNMTSDYASNLMINFFGTYNSKNINSIILNGQTKTESINTFSTTQFNNAVFVQFYSPYTLPDSSGNIHFIVNFDKNNFNLGNTYYVSYQVTGQYGTKYPNTAGITSNAIYCLCENTEVLTQSGYKLIQDLNNDDLVITSDSRHVQIKKIYKTRVNAKNNDNYWPVIIPANSIGEKYPERDCKMSQYHAIKLNDNWIMPNKNMGIFKKDTSEEVINYYHIQLQNYKTDNLVINGGLVVESLGDGSTEDSLEWELRNNQSIIL